MLVRYNPAEVAPPFSAYSHAVEGGADLRWLHISGQVGVEADGSLAESSASQIDQTWLNVLAILAGARMGPHDLVKVTAYLTDREDIGLFREIRDARLEGAQPASTLVVVSGLADPEWRVEIEAVAAAKG